MSGNIYGCCSNKKFKKYNCGSCDIKMSQPRSSSACTLEFMSIAFTLEARTHLSPKPGLTEQQPRASDCHGTGSLGKEMWHFSRSWLLGAGAEMSCSVSEGTGLRTARGRVRVISMCIRPVITPITRLSQRVDYFFICFQEIRLTTAPSDAFRIQTMNWDKYIFLRF